MVRKYESYLADQARVDADDRSLVSRTDLRRQEKQEEASLIALAVRLVGMNATRLASLELSEGLLEAVEETRRIKSPGARQRALRRVRKELRGLDWEGLERRLLALVGPA